MFAINNGLSVLFCQTCMNYYDFNCELCSHGLVYCKLIALVKLQDGPLSRNIFDLHV